MTPLADTLYRRAPSVVQVLLLNMHAARINRHRYGREFAESLARFRAMDRWTEDEVGRFQDAAIRDIVDFAFNHSEHYRTSMERLDLEPGDITNRDELLRLPLLTKAEVRDHAASIMTSPRPATTWLHGHTSGTTGSPLGLWYDRTMCSVNNAADRFHRERSGVTDGAWIGVFLGRTIVPPTCNRRPFWRPNYVHREVWFSSFHMTEENLDSYLAEIRRRKLEHLEGYPSTLYVLARHLIERGLRLPLKSVITSSETLHRVQRESIEYAFECRVYDFYAHAERVIYASECPADGGKHVFEGYGFTEVVDDAGNRLRDGEFGYLVGTSFHNRAMPMLRYRTGDVSALVPTPCKCGSMHRRIESVSTKAEDIVVTADGRRISPSILTHPFKPFDQIAVSQIIQESVTFVRVLIVARDRFTESDETSLKRSLEERLGSGMRIEIERVDDIPRERSGKFRWVISRVDHSCSLDWISR